MLQEVRTMSTKAAANPFATLTWDDVDAWAGSTIVARGKTYQRSNRVQKLARTTSGGLVAWVYGTSRYATQVDIKKKQLTSSCTCPYWSTCKHAVAVLLTYLEALKSQKEIPVVEDDDPRIALIQEAADAEATLHSGELQEDDEEEDDDVYPEDDFEDDDDYDDEDEEDEDNEEEDDDDEDDEPTVKKRPVARRPQPVTSDGATTYLEQQSKEDLISLLKELMRHHPDVREAIVDRANLLSGEVKKIVATARKEIHALYRTPSWGDDEDWSHGSDGNFTRLRTHLEALLASGHADEVLSLGQELLKAGAQQIETIDDDGMTADEIISCMNIVFRALAHSSLSPAEQMLWAIDVELNDEYDLCQGTEEFWQHSFSKEDWHIVTDQLTSRLQKFSSESRSEGFTTKYRREQLGNFLIRALEHAGRKDEIIPLCEREAGKTDSYARLIQHLKAAKRWQEMEEWIHKGIKATRKQAPGIAADLRLALRERREQEKNWLQVAAFYAEDFFAEPCARTLRDLLKAAKRAGVEAAVRAGAFHYLETGALPQAIKSPKKKGNVTGWPLPECEVKGLEERQKTTAPMRNALIDIAIDEKRPDEVLRWYDQKESRKSSTWGYHWHDEDQIATAIADAYPDRAITMWKNMVDSQLTRAEWRSYETAATYLRKIHSTSKKHGQEQEWKTYLADLRQANLRRPRLVQTLDGLTGKPIVEL
jgi:uncharacterized Zn finger protein